MKNIVVPIDFSDESVNGLITALMFSKYKRVNIQMVYVQKKSSDYYPSTREKEYQFAEEKFKELVLTHQKKLPEGSDLSFIIKKGKIFEEVVHQAESFAESMIIASTHGASGFEELFIGSNAYKIITATDKPVITVRKQPVSEGFERIMMPVDLSDDSRQKVAFTVSLAELFEAEIFIFGITPARSSLDKLKAYVSQVGGFIGKRVPFNIDVAVDSNIAEKILEKSEIIQSDLISIMTEQVGALGLLLGNSAHHIITHSNVPVLSNTPKEIRVSGSFATMG